MQIVKYIFVTDMLPISDPLIPAYSWGGIQIGFTFRSPSKLSDLSMQIPLKIFLLLLLAVHFRTI